MRLSLRHWIPWLVLAALAAGAGGLVAGRTTKTERRIPLDYRTALKAVNVHVREYAPPGQRICVFGEVPALRKLLKDLDITETGPITPESERDLTAILDSRPIIVIDATAQGPYPLSKLRSAWQWLQSSYDLVDYVYLRTHARSPQVAFKIFRRKDVMPLAQRPVLAGGWRFDGNGRDFWYEGRPAKLRHAKFARGVFGRSVWIDSKDGFVDLEIADQQGRIDDFPGPRGFTVAFWVRPLRMENFARFFEFGNDIDQDAVYLSCVDSSNMLRLEAFHRGRVIVKREVPNSISMNEWQHFAVVFNPGSFTIYKNGEVLAQGPMDELRHIRRRVNWLARSAWPTGVFHGMFDDFFMYGQALDVVQIRRLMRGQIPGA